GVREEDVEWLRDRYRHLGADLLRSLALSPHPHAYNAGLMALCALEGADELVSRTLVDFLEFGTQRMRDWRLRAAEWLYRSGDRLSALPILLTTEPSETPTYPALLAGAPPQVVEGITESVLLSGLGETAEEMLLAMLNQGRLSGFLSWSVPPDSVEPIARQAALGRLLTE